MNFCQKFYLIFLALLVLLSYYTFLQTDEKYDSYLNHPFWFGMSPTIIKMLMVFQAFAIIGFLTTIINWIQYPPKEGIMHDNNLFYTISLFLISAAIWPVATQYKIHFLAISSIILTAIASILLLAGTVEERKEDIKWYKILGMLLLCIVTVLVDGVLWNANYIKQLH